MKPQNEDLRIRTKHFALRIIKLYASLPRVAVAQTLGKQLLRSGTSVGANYREARRARSNPEFVSKLGDALKELEETSYWLELLGESATIRAQRLGLLTDEAYQLIAIFTAISKKFEGNNFILHPSTFSL
jgi:four helix bundle protein